MSAAIISPTSPVNDGRVMTNAADLVRLAALCMANGNEAVANAILKSFHA